MDEQYIDDMTEAYRALAKVTWLSNVQALELINAIKNLDPGWSYAIHRPLT